MQDHETAGWYGTVFQAGEHAFAVFDGQSIRLGEIVDIDPEGLAVRYLVDGDSRLGETRQIDILMGAHDFYLEKVPVVKVADLVEKSFSMATTITRIIALRFGELTREQKCRLETFISRHRLPLIAAQ